MKKSDLVKILSLTVLFLSINRGLIALFTKEIIPTQLLYYGVTLFGISVSLIGLTTRNKLFKGGKTLYQLLIINLLIYIYWLLCELLLGGMSESILYFSHMALIPFVIYLFLDIDENVLIRMLFTVSVIISTSCILDFILLNTNIIPAGKDFYMHYQTLLRQDNRPLLNHVAFVYRANGITGSSYDSGNMLAILSPFWLAMLATRKNTRYLIIFVPFFFISLLTTFSVTNILASLAGVVIIFIYKMSCLKRRDIKAIFTICVTSSVMFFMIDHFCNFDWSLLTIWTKKFQSIELQSATRLGTSDYFTDTLLFFTGHAQAVRLSDVPFTTEFAVLKMAYHSGFFILIISLLLMLYPVLCFIKSSSRTRMMMLPATVAVGVGVLSLCHYGSVIRSTNIFLFYTMFAIAIHNKRCELLSK
ncbi:MAG: hypothetical protein FVQ82_06460 [Planctomycetes bacterium]|nr:hypothetical protein [Planctomycetota bacterium]